MWSRFFNGLEEAVIGLLLVVMTLIVFFEVVLRFGFNTGTVWADELVLHLSAWMVLFGASYGIKVGSHIGVDAIVKIVSRDTRRVMTLIAIILSLVYCGLLIDGSWVYLRKVYRIGIELEDLPIPKYAAHSILLIGYAMLALRIAQLGWRVITNKADSFGLADEAAEALETLVEEQHPGRAGS